MKGRFVVLEGMDGCGSTTQLAKLGSYLSKKEGIHVFLTKEPTGFEIGTKIKRKLKEDKALGINPFEDKGEEYAFLYTNDRRSHVENVIKPILEKGIHVICDRFKYSTLVYQQVQGMSWEWLMQLHHNLLVPDLVVIIDLPAEEAMKRRIGDQTTPEFFEKLDFQEEVRNHYVALKEKLPTERIVIIDGTEPIESVHQKIKDEFNKI